MSLVAIFELIYAFLKSIPIINGAVRDFLIFYQKKELNETLVKQQKAIEDLKNATTDEEIKQALDQILANRV